MPGHSSCRLRRWSVVSTRFLPVWRCTLVTPEAMDTPLQSTLSYVMPRVPVSLNRPAPMLRWAIRVSPVVRSPAVRCSVRSVLVARIFKCASHLFYSTKWDSPRLSWRTTTRNDDSLACGNGVGHHSGEQSGGNLGNFTATHR